MQVHIKINPLSVAMDFSDLGNDCSLFSCAIDIQQHINSTAIYATIDGLSTHKLCTWELNWH